MNTVTRRTFTSRVLAAAAGLAAGVRQVCALTPKPYRGVVDDDGNEWHTFIAHENGVEIGRGNATGIYEHEIMGYYSLDGNGGGEKWTRKIIWLLGVNGKLERMFDVDGKLKIYRLEHGREVLFWPKEGV